VTGMAAVRSISLQYGSDRRTLVPETTSVVPEFIAGTDVATSWSWEMKKTGSMPPGAVVWWSWEVTDDDGQTTTTSRGTIVYSDTRFEWQLSPHPDYDIYWHDQTEALIDGLLDAVEARLSRIKLDVVIPAARKPRVYIYRSSEELQGAVLFEQEWTGALAYPEYNIILTAVGSGSLEWAKGALPHEITHLLVGEATFGPFGGIPTWLNEGLAQYTETPMADYLQRALDNAIADSTLMSIRSLSGSFPADPTAAYLAYAESSSIVSFLIEEYGWEKMDGLLAAFKEGATDNNALLQVYAFDVDGLEAAWKAYIGAR
jgi:hypothetical protein